MKHLLLAAVATIALASVAQAGPLGSLSAQWYDLASNDQDVGQGVDGGIVTGLVANTLGIDGLPVYTGKIAPASGQIKDLNAAGEILWWSTANPNVKVDPGYPTTVPLPVNYPANLFPSGYTANGGAGGYLTAHLFGSFDTPAGGSITLTLGSDDDAWVFIDGTLVVDNGGVHARLDAPSTITSLSAGTHRIDLFFDDRHEVQAALDFSSNLTLNPVTPVPEPVSLAVIGSGLLSLGLLRRRR